MAFHTIAWFESIADSTEVDMNPVQDGIITIQNNHFQPQFDWGLVYADVRASGTTSPTARLNTPLYRQFSPMRLVPVNSSTFLGDPEYVHDFRANPLKVPKLEELQFLALQDSGGPLVVTCVAGITSQAMPAMSGNMYTMIGSSTTASTSGQWSLVTVTWADNLPTGRYQAVGLTYIAGGGVAARLVFEDQVPRPGCPATLPTNITSPQIMRYGRLGSWGEFDNNRMPSIEVLTDGVAPAHTFYLDYVQIR